MIQPWEPEAIEDPSVHFFHLPSLLPAEAAPNPEIVTNFLKFFRDPDAVVDR